jgi:hypothetical protein
LHVVFVGVVAGFEDGEGGHGCLLKVKRQARNVSGIPLFEYSFQVAHH